jgi:hypothetical protein
MGRVATSLATPMQITPAESPLHTTVGADGNKKPAEAPVGSAASPSLVGDPLKAFSQARCRQGGYSPTRARLPICPFGRQRGSLIAHNPFNVAVMRGCPL